MNQQSEAGERRSVLVVDDEYAVRDMLRRAAVAFGYRAKVAADGHEALACLARQDYDVVICDLVMPNMNGDELFRICQQEHPEVTSRFVFISGCGVLPAGSLAARGGQPFLAKPCRMAELWSVIDRIAPPVAAA